MSKKECELCSNPARMFCDSDQASLCWDCDEKVHAANFLVAKHLRTLLCHLCHSPTPWKAAGPKLAPTLSVCHSCARRGGSIPSSAVVAEQDGGEIRSDGDSERGYDTTDSGDSSEEEEEEEDDDDVDENQVVPWSDSPPEASTSADKEEEEEDESVSLSSSKRARADLLASSEDEDGCCSSQYEEGDENCSSALRPSKLQRCGGAASASASASASGTAAIVEKLWRFEQEIVRKESLDASAMIIGLCNLTRDC